MAEEQIRVNIKRIDNADQDHENIIKAGAKIIEEVLRLADFKEHVLSATFEGGTHFKNTNGKVRKPKPDEIANIILHGVERGTNKDYIIDMEISLYPHKRTTVGSAILGKGPIMPAFWFIEECVAGKDGISVARHLIHEWLHVAGFFHAGSGSKQKDVPYIVGDIVRKLAKEKGKELASSGRPLELAPGEPWFGDFIIEDRLAAYLLDESEHELLWE